MKGRVVVETGEWDPGKVETCLFTILGCDESWKCGMLRSDKHAICPALFFIRCPCRDVRFSRETEDRRKIQNIVIIWRETNLFCVCTQSTTPKEAHSSTCLHAPQRHYASNLSKPPPVSGIRFRVSGFLLL